MDKGGTFNKKIYKILIIFKQVFEIYIYKLESLFCDYFHMS